MESGKKTSFDSELTGHIFQNLDLPNIGDASGLQNSAGDGNFYLALYQTAPTDSYQGVEATFGNYARMAVARNSLGWAVSGFDVTNTSRVIFPTCGAVSGRVEAFSINVGGVVGIDDAIYWGYLIESLNVIQGQNVVFAIGSFSL